MDEKLEEIKASINKKIDEAMKKLNAEWQKFKKKEGSEQAEYIIDKVKSGTADKAASIRVVFEANKAASVADALLETNKILRSKEAGDQSTVSAEITKTLAERIAIIQAQYERGFGDEPVDEKAIINALKVQEKKQEEHHALLEMQELLHQKKLQELASRAAEERLKFEKMSDYEKGRYIIGELQSFTAEGAKENKVSFAINKVANIGDSFAGSYESVKGAYDAGKAVGGETIGYLNGLAALAAELPEISDAFSATFGDEKKTEGGPENSIALDTAGTGAGLTLGLAAGLAPVGGLSPGEVGGGALPEGVEAFKAAMAQPEGGIAVDAAGTGVGLAFGLASASSLTPGEAEGGALPEGAEAFEAVMAQKEEQNLALEELETQHQERLTAIEADSSEAQKKLWQEGWEGKAKVVSGVMGSLSQLMNSENKKQFEIGKKAAIAQAVIDTYLGAQRAYSALAGIVPAGPALGAAAAAAAIAAGMARVNAIKSQSFGGGGGGAGGAAGGGAPSLPGGSTASGGSSAATGGTTSSKADAPAERQKVFVEFQGNEDSKMTARQWREFMRNLQEEAGDAQLEF